MDIFSVIRSGDFKRVKQWLETEPDFNKPNDNGQTPIIYASCYGRTKIVKLLLAQPGIDFNKPDDNGQTPIIYASCYGCTEIVKLLLAQPGIDFNKANNNGWTPIHSASNNDHVEIVKLLLAQFGIDFNKANNKGNIPINIASNYGCTEIVHILKEYEKNPIKMRNFYLRKYFPHIIEEYFILMVLCSDDYFVCTNKGEIGRFFKIVIKMPQELQSLIANRIIGSSCDIPRLSFINEAIKKFFN
jgi:ankyrin repeat protein